MTKEWGLIDGQKAMVELVERIKRTTNFSAVLKNESLGDMPDAADICRAVADVYMGHLQMVYAMGGGKNPAFSWRSLWKNLNPGNENAPPEEVCEKLLGGEWEENAIKSRSAEVKARVEEIKNLYSEKGRVAALVPFRKLGNSLHEQRKQTKQCGNPGRIVKSMARFDPVYQSLAELLNPPPGDLSILHEKT